MSKPLDAIKNKGYKGSCDRWFTTMLSKADRGDLRRAGSVEALYANESVHKLERQLPGANDTDDLAWFQCVAGLAALLAGLKADSNNVLLPAKPMAARAGSKNTNDMPKFSRVRVGKLFAAQEIDKRLRAFRELLRILDNSADANDVAEYFLHWHDAKVRWHFARSYFNPDRNGDESGDAAINIAA